MKIHGSLEEITKNKLNELYDGKVPQKNLKRYNYEMKVIHEKRLENNYLLAYEIVEKARQDNRIIIDRICGSSYIDYLLGMTFVDPIKYELSNDLRCDATFYCGVSADYFQTIYDYLKVIFKKYKLSNKFDTDELKKYGISLERNSYAKKLEELEKETKLGRYEIDLNDINVYINLNNNEEFSLEKYKQLFNTLHPNSINRLADMYSLMQSSFYVGYDELLCNCDLKIFPYTRDHIYSYLLKRHIKREDAIVITKFIYKGRIHSDSKTWNVYKKHLIQHNVECQYIKILESIGYLWPRSICITRTIIIYGLAYYQLYYPKDYNKVMLSYVGEK